MINCHIVLVLIFALCQIWSSAPTNKTYDSHHAASTDKKITDRISDADSKYLVMFLKEGVLGVSPEIHRKVDPGICS